MEKVPIDQFLVAHALRNTKKMYSNVQLTVCEKLYLYKMCVVLGLIIYYKNALRKMS